eukprot:CAMPEP_0176479938 /NCGR_PEP_ID=MMETSP0200_2-20121128/2013_1 /TAXON_ID=947934 /ORGANISM="Chaetoceros sp., Strain GSL56" /LENGTH=957 /DNA_ID=CAMNT_0017876029 /DNA_START=209 /DNA_END=3080 /DNA_ORIENTATION=+
MKRLTSMFRLRKSRSDISHDSRLHACENSNSNTNTPIRKSRSSGFVPMPSSGRGDSRVTSFGAGFFMDLSDDGERDMDTNSENEQTFYTDHERFSNTYYTTIRYSDYRRLVLPPECKLLDPSKIKQGQVDYNLRSNAAWLKLVDDFHRIISFDYPGYLILFNIRIFKALQYRWTKMWGGKVIEEEEEDEDDNTVASNSSRRSLLSKDESVAGSISMSAQVNWSNSSTLDQNVSYSEGSAVVDQRAMPVSPLHPRSPSATVMDYGVAISSPPRDETQSKSVGTSRQEPQAGNDSQFAGKKSPLIRHRERFYTGDDRELDYEQSAVRYSPKRHSSINRGDNVDVSTHSLELLHEDASEDMWVPMMEDVERDDSAKINSFANITERQQDVDVTASCANGEDGTSPVRLGLENGVPQATNHIVSTSESKLLESLAIPTLPRKVTSLGNKQKDNLEKYRNISNKVVIQPNFNSLEVSGTPRPGLEQKSKSHEMVYFDTATNDASIKQLERIAPLPDREGYILGDQIFEDPRDTPLLVFVNTRSGSQQGPILKTQLGRLLNPIQIWDLADGGPEKVLKSFSVFTRLRLLVCGGDGTVSWIISTLDKMKLDRWPPIAILPLGTGNDLARIHGWGAGYANESLLMILDQITESYVSLLDRWTMTIEQRKKKKAKEKKIKTKPFINYMSIGMDALSALQVHTLRENSPNMFFSRAVNKIWYALFGAEDAIKASCSDLPKQIILEADGVKIPIPKDSQGLIFLNIDSYLGGVPLWSRGVPILKRRSRQLRRYSEGDFLGMSDADLLENRSRLPSYDESDSSVACDVNGTEFEVKKETYQEKLERLMACNTPSSCQDGKLDVISHRGNFNLGVGLTNAQRLCQCSKVKITMKKSIAVQVDGEPWKQDSGVLTIERQKEPAMMLHRALEEGGGIETEVANLLEWAEEKKIIQRDTHAILMKEFSRRIEK